MEILRELEHLCYDVRLGRECVPIGLGRDACAQMKAQMTPYGDNIQISLTWVLFNKKCEGERWKEVGKRWQRERKRAEEHLLELDDLLCDAIEDVWMCIFT